MKLMLQRAGRYDDYIRRSRLEICALIGLDPIGDAVEPLPHAFYLFGFEDGPDPVAMAEFFFYDEDDFRTRSTATRRSYGRPPRSTRSSTRAVCSSTPDTGTRSDSSILSPHWWRLPIGWELAT